tara:strand:- start:1090 stop:1299 length:210 start_codon:yes stop_codon:yes gene_type:complete
VKKNAVYKIRNQTTEYNTDQIECVECSRSYIHLNMIQIIYGAGGKKRKNYCIRCYNAKYYGEKSVLRRF